ncbi:MAG: sulfite exporter TauE/SafE family protein [Betaproteobacteria bacterium]
MANIDLSHLALFAIALALTGCLSGFLAGLLGVGGGIIVVPILYILFPALGVAEEVRMHLAVGTSLATVIPNAITSARSHHAKGSLDFDLLRKLGPPIILGVIGGSIFGGKSSGQVLIVIFASLALLVAFYMAFRRDSWVIRRDLTQSFLLRTPIGLFIGWFSVLMGIGGGTLSVPMMNLFNIEMRRAVGTGAAFGILIGIPGLLGFIATGWGNPLLPPLSLGYCSLIGVAMIVPSSMMMVKRGVSVAHSIEQSLLRKIFACFLLTTSIKMFFSAFGS